MVGPFVQGVFLIGIIYWYSKGMMSMINDYYRSEFQRKLSTESGAKQAAQAQLNVDNFMDYVRELDAKDLTNYKAMNNVADNSLNPQLGNSYILLRFMQITGAAKQPDFCSTQQLA
ncbi:CG42508, partial [Drosophila busckii]